MEFPSWFQNAIQRRVDRVSAWVEHHPDLQPFRVEESQAFEAMMAGLDRTQLPGFREWEDKHHFKLGLEQERLYLQGMRDGAQLMLALLTDPLASVGPGAAQIKTAASDPPETEGTEDKWPE